MSKVTQRQANQRRRKKLPDASRKLLWKIYFGPDSTQGSCFVCGQTITLDAFEAGHYIAWAKGGGDELANLRPVCRTCNASMGNESIPNFKRKYFPHVSDLESWDPEKNPDYVTITKQTLDAVQELPERISSLLQIKLPTSLISDSDLPKGDAFKKQLGQARGDIQGGNPTAAVDAIKRDLRLHTSPSQRAVLYNMLGEECYRLGDLSGAQAAWQKVLGVADLFTQEEENEKKRVTATALNRIGVVLRTQSNLSKAKDYHYRALTLFKGVHNLKGEAAAANNMGIVLHTQGDLPEALRYYRRARALFKRLGNLEGQATTLNNIAVILRMRDDLDGALRNCRRACALFKRLGNLEGQATALNTIAMVVDTQGDLLGSLRYYRRAHALFKRLGNLEGQAAALDNIGVIFRKQGDIRRCLRHHRRALALLESMRAGASPAAGIVRRNIASAEQQVRASVVGKAPEPPDRRGRRAGTRQKAVRLTTIRR